MLTLVLPTQVLNYDSYLSKFFSVDLLLLDLDLDRVIHKIKKRKKGVMKRKYFMCPKSKCYEPNVGYLTIGHVLPICLFTYLVMGDILKKGDGQTLV